MFVIAIEFRACLSYSCLARMAAPVGESTNRQLLLVSASCNADHLGEPRAPGRTLTFSCVSICAADGNFAVKGSDYRLVVRGELDQRFAYLFNGMGMKRREGITSWKDMFEIRHSCTD